MTSRRPGDGRFLSIGTKLTAATVIVVAAASALVFVELSGRERHSAVSAKQKAAEMVGDLFAASLAAPLDFGDSDAVAAELDHVAANPEVTYAAAFAADAATAVKSIGDPAPAAPGEAVEVHRGVRGKDGRALGTAVVRFSLARENASYTEARARIFGLCVILAALTAAVLIAITRRLIVSPLDALGSAVQKVERGEANAAVVVRANDEIGRLARGVERMKDAIFDREQRLASAHRSLRELFDHMSQAIVVFGPGGAIADEGSHAAEELFGDVRGRKVQELFYGEAESWRPEARAFTEWTLGAFDVAPEDWDAWAALAPREATLVLGAHEEGSRASMQDAGGARTLELELRPVVQDGSVARVMLLANDVTVERRLEREVRARTREAAAVRRLVAGGAQVFVSFLEGGRRRLARAVEILEPSPRPLSPGEVEEIFRHLHTVRGEAHAFDLGDLAARMVELEALLQPMRDQARSDGSATTDAIHAEFLAGIEAARARIAEAEERFVAGSPIGRGALEQTSVRRSDVERLAALTRGQKGELAEIAGRLAARPFGEIVGHLVDQVPSWAEGQKKRARLEIEGRERLVPPRVAEVVGGAITHLVRNAIAHAVEEEEERAHAGKPRAGLIRVACDEGPRGPSFTVEDDGRGIAEDEVRARASELGRTGGTVDDLLAMPGLSTKSGALSGRGVGLGAVRAEMAALGYALSVASSKGEGTRFVLAVDGAPTRREDASP